MATTEDKTVPGVSVATATPRLQPGEAIKPLDLVDSEAVSNLARGFLAVLEPELVRVHRSLEELVVWRNAGPHPVYYTTMSWLVKYMMFNDWASAVGSVCFPQ
jgi:hypothetical protein